MSFTETSRRDFLKGTGVLVVSSTLVPLVASCARGSAATRTLAPDQVDAFLAIDARGGVTVYSGKVDLGTGVRTALTQIAADELDVPLDLVTVIEGDTALTPDQGVTSGSLSIEKGGMQIRQAAATARRALVQQAAQRLGIPAGDLVVENGTVRSRSGGTQATYGELLRGRTFSLKIDSQAPLKDPASYTIVGRSVARLDIPAKVTGRFTFMQNVRVPGMLHGRVVRPPAIGAALQSVDEASVTSVPGLVKVVRLGNFLGVVAETEWGAITAVRKLRATWSAWAGLPDERRLWQHVRDTAVVKNDVTSDVGNVEQALPRAARRLAATYDFAMHTHGSIGPSCAIAEIKDGTLTCWSASQATHDLCRQLATMLSMPERDVRVIYVEGAGCYGRNGHEDAAADAVLLARAVGRPVRVQWMRADEHGWDPKGPPTLIDLQAGLDEIGRVLAWSSQFFVPQGATGDVELLAVGLANTFANESFMDELASAVQADPIAFRLRYLDDPRGTEVLRRLARLASWSGRGSGRRETGDVATGRGVSYVKYELYRTYVGAVATVEVKRKTGVLRATHFAIVHDCGQIINPDGVRNQIEGNVVQTVSRTLKEQVTFDRSRVTSLDWVGYPILTFPEIPTVDIELVDRPTDKPWGAGEPAAAVVPAAIANAVFDAIGVRLRSVPLTPAKVLAAIRAGS